LLSKCKYGLTAWNKAAEKGRFEVLEKLWNWAKDVQLKPEELRNELLFSEGKYGQTAWDEALERERFDILY
jgi:hypothetical protein